MRKSGLLVASVIASGLALSASPALAVYTGVNVTGGGQEISTMTIKLPGNDTVTADQTTPGHFGINITTPAKPGTIGTATITTKDGKHRQVPVFVNDDGSVNVLLPQGNCFVPGLCGTVGADYAHISPSSGTDGDLWGFSAAAKIPFNVSYAGAQVDVGYHRVSSSGSDLDNWNIGLAIPFDMGSWRAGPAIGYQSASASFYSLDTYNVGAFADAFFPRFAVSGKFGVFSSNVSGADGMYFGAGVTWFPCPDFAASTTWDHTTFSTAGSADEDDVTFTGEYKINGPFSLYGGYTRTSFTQGNFILDTFFLGFRVYCDDNGATTLEERHDTGTVGWGTSFKPFGSIF